MKRAALLRQLLSDLFPGNLAPDHLKDLQSSGLEMKTIKLQKIRSVPPWMIGKLLEFEVPEVCSALLFPFPDYSGRISDHVRLKVFPTFVGYDGKRVKYLQRKGSEPHLFFPVLQLEKIFRSYEPLWIVEGEKKALAVAQLGLPAVGICGIEGWHKSGSTELLGDFADIPLRDRVIEIAPDGDWRTNSLVSKGANRLALALSETEAKPGIRLLPDRVES